jgi:2-polyprenyl-6-methoxyphenol hydroxylase-like FAD-dependent oxidoreductase
VATKQKEPSILVVGAGVTGLTLACVLKRHGASVRLIDKLPGRRPFARAVGIHSRTLEIFQDLGLVDAFLKSGHKTVAFEQFANGKLINRAHCEDLDSPYPFSVHLEQWKTEGFLEQRLGELGGCVERETELAAIEERLDGVRATLHLADGSSEVVDVPWLVGCDGAHSAVRHLNHQHFPGETDPRQYLIADLLFDAPLARDTIFAFLSDAGALFVAPLPEGRTLVFGDVADDFDQQVDPPTLEDVKAFVASRCPKPVTLSDPRWIGVFRTNYRLTPHYRHGRTFLAGDAAHIHSSVGGQGMNTGIQDAYNLGWKLALVSVGSAPESLLDSYDTERRAIGADVVAMTKSLAERAYSYSGLSAKERDRNYRHVYVPEAERLSGVRHMEELDLDYRKSPICVEHGLARDRGDGQVVAPHAGAQAIEVGPLEVNGEKLSLFGLIAGPYHTLLLFAASHGQGQAANVVHLADEVMRVYGDLIQVCVVIPADSDAPALAGTAAKIVRDLEGAMHDRYAAHAGHTYFIRPDGYVAWRSRQPTLTAFRDYLAKVLVCP